MSVKKFIARTIALTTVATLLMTYSSFGLTSVTTPDATGSFADATLQIGMSSMTDIHEHDHDHIDELVTPVATPAPAPAPAPAPVATPQVAAATTPTTPYNLTMDGVAADLTTLGYSLSALQAQSITVQGHVGAIPKRCVSGPTGASTSQGLALRRTNYTPCANGEQPIYEAYRPAPYACSVVYNKNSSKRLAILAHEVGHCLHQLHGEYKKFDIDYKAMRGAGHLSRTGLREVIADDFMICKHGLDTAWGAGSYYNKYGMSYPTAEQCAAFNTLVNDHLL